MYVSCFVRHFVPHPDSDFLLDSPPEDLSAGDIRWLYNSSKGTFNVFSKMVEKKKRYEVSLVTVVMDNVFQIDL